jgi:hypothetical protein
VGADERRARPDEHLCDAAARPDELGVLAEPVLGAEGVGEVAEVLGQPLGSAVRKQSPTGEDDDEEGPREQRQPGQGELEEAERPGAGIHGGLADDDVHRRPGEREHRPGVRREGERQEHLGRGEAGARRDDDDDRQQGRDRPVDADQGREQRDEQADEDEQGRPARPAARDELLTRPGGHPGRVQRLGDDEERGDEQDRRVAEPRKGLAEVEDTGRPQGEGDADGDDPERDPVRDEGEDRADEDEQGRRHRVHGVVSPSPAAGT